MSDEHSWKWLAPRVPARQIADVARAGAPSRPCLPAVESMGDRLMFSLATDVPAEPPAPVTSGEILIGLLKGQFAGEDALLKQQFELMEAFNDHFTDADYKYGQAVGVTHDLVKISEVVFKYVGDALVGQATPLSKVQSQLDATLSKLTDLAASAGTGENNLLLPAVQKVREAAGAVLADASRPLVKLSLDSKLYSKVTSYFSDITGGLLKLGQDVIYNKKGNGDQQYLKIKFEEVLISSFKISDEGVKAELGALVDVAEDVYDGLLNPGDGGGGDGGGPIFLGGLRVEDGDSEDLLR